MIHFGSYGLYLMGAKVLKLVSSARGSDFRYEINLIAEEDDLVMVYGRYSGWKEVPVISVDIFRIKDGMAEHWDVLHYDVKMIYQ